MLNHKTFFIHVINRQTIILFFQSYCPFHYVESFAGTKYRGKALVKEAKKKAKPYEETFLGTIPSYLECLDVSCKCLADVAQWKQDMLEKKLHHDVKMVRDVSEYNNILKAYEKAQNDLVQAGAFVRAGWVEVIQGITKEGEGK